MSKTHWQDATAGTITRIQQIFGLRQLTEDQQIRLIERAQVAVAAQGMTKGATEYWNTFVNCLRTLVAGMSECDPKDTFD